MWNKGSIGVLNQITDIENNLPFDILGFDSAIKPSELTHSTGQSESAIIAGMARNIVIEDLKKDPASKGFTLEQAKDIDAYRDAYLTYIGEDPRVDDAFVLDAGPV